MEQDADVGGHELILDRVYQVVRDLRRRPQTERRAGSHGPVTLSSLRGDEDWLFGGGEVWSGEQINHRTAMTYAAYWRAISIVANGCARLPLKLQRNTGDGAETLKADPRYRLMRYKPNPWTLAQDFIRTRVYHAMDWGNGYAAIVRVGGRPVELRQLPAGTTWPERKAGKLRYHTEYEQDGRWVKKELDPEDVFHIRGLGDDGICGYDVVQYAKQTLGLGLAAQRHGSNFFRHGASPGIIFEHPGNLGPEALQNLRQTMSEAIEGVLRAHKPFILEEGMKAHELQADHQKTQFIELRKFEIRDIANVSGVPAYLLGDSEQSAYASLEQRSQDFLDHTLNPWLLQIEQEATDKMLSDAEKDAGLYFEFERAAIIQVDHKTKVDAATTELNNGGLTLNEYRRIMNRSRVEGTMGDRHRMPVNIAHLEEPTEDDGAAADLAFKREVVKAYIADGTVGDVIFNLTDGRKLLEEVNIETIPDMEEPWLPVVAQSGPLVSGGTIVDDAGDVVGGDIISDTGVDLGDDEQVRSAYERIRRRARQMRERAARSLATLERDTWARTTRRIAHQAVRAAAKPEGFVGFVESIERHRTALIDALLPVRNLRGKSAADTSAAVAKYFTWIRGQLLKAAEVRPNELAGSIRRWAAPFAPGA